jgi:hypothetical protein
MEKDLRNEAAKKMVDLVEKSWDKQGLTEDERDALVSGHSTGTGEKCPHCGSTDRGVFLGQADGCTAANHDDWHDEIGSTGTGRTPQCPHCIHAPHIGYCLAPGCGCLITSREAAPVTERTEETPTLDESQAKLVVWGTECFGAEHMADRKVRALRLMEEAIEFSQAVEAPIEQCRKLVDYVYSRPPGKPTQELGGIGVTWLVAAAALGESAAEALRCEMERIAKKLPSHFAKRNQQKLDAGFDAQGEAASEPPTQPATTLIMLLNEAWGLLDSAKIAIRDEDTLRDWRAAVEPILLTGKLAAAAPTG